MKTKQCFKCEEEKELSCFYKHPDMPDGTVNKCKDCNKKDVRKNWWDNVDKKREYDVYRQRHSISRIINHRYAGIKRRCEIGGNDGRKYFVTGTEYLTKQDFVDWVYKKNNFKVFTELYDNWVQSDFNTKLSPSIDRINPKKGYVASNLQWLSKSDNCKKYNK